MSFYLLLVALDHIIHCRITFSFVKIMCPLLINLINYLRKETHAIYQQKKNLPQNLLMLMHFMICIYDLTFNTRVRSRDALISLY